MIYQFFIKWKLLFEEHLYRVNPKSFFFKYEPINIFYIECLYENIKKYIM